MQSISKSRPFLSLLLVLIILLGSFFGSYQKAYANPLLLVLGVGVESSAVVTSGLNTLGVIGTYLLADYTWENREDVIYTAEQVWGNLSSASRSAIDKAISLGGEVINLGSDVLSEIRKSVTGIVAGLSYKTTAFTDTGHGIFNYSTYSDRYKAKTFSLGQVVNLGSNKLELVYSHNNNLGDFYNISLNGNVLNSSVTVDLNGKQVSLNAVNWNLNLSPGEVPYWVLVNQNGSVSLFVYGRNSSGTSELAFTTPLATGVAVPTGTYTQPKEKANNTDESKGLSIPTGLLGGTVAGLAGVGEYGDATVSDLTDGVTVKDNVVTGTDAGTGTGLIDKTWLGQKIDSIIKYLANIWGFFSLVPSSAALHLDAFKKLGTGLTTVFPFSIPWDIINAIKGLVDAPKAPVFVFDLRNTPLIGGSVLTIDLGQFEAWAKIVRWGVLIIFNIGLIVLTRKIIS